MSWALHAQRARKWTLHCFPLTHSSACIHTPHNQQLSIPSLFLFNFSSFPQPGSQISSLAWRFIQITTIFYINDYTNFCFFCMFFSSCLYYHYLNLAHHHFLRKLPQVRLIFMWSQYFHALIHYPCLSQNGLSQINVQLQSGIQQEYAGQTLPYSLLLLATAHCSAYI